MTQQIFQCARCHYEMVAKAGEWCASCEESLNDVIDRRLATAEKMADNLIALCAPKVNKFKQTKEKNQLHTHNAFCSECKQYKKIVYWYGALSGKTGSPLCRSCAGEIFD